MITPTTVIWMHKHTICLSKINLSSKSSPKPPTGLDAWFINSLCLFLQKTKLPGQSRRGSGVKQCLQLVWLESSVSQLIENLKIRINTISQLIMAPYFLWDNRKPFYNVSRKVGSSHSRYPFLLLFESNKTVSWLGVTFWGGWKKVAYIQKLISILRALKEKPDFAQVFSFRPFWNSSKKMLICQFHSIKYSAFIHADPVFLLVAYFCYSIDHDRCFIYARFVEGP